MLTAFNLSRLINITGIDVFKRYLEGLILIPFKKLKNRASNFRPNIPTIKTKSRLKRL